MLDIKFLRENPEIIKENIRKKYQDYRLPLVDEAIKLDAENRAIKQEVEDLRAKRNRLSKEIGKLMGQKKREEAEAVKAEVSADGARCFYDDTVEELSAGDVHYCPEGHGHSMTNPYEEDLIFFGVVPKK